MRRPSSAASASRPAAPCFAPAGPPFRAARNVKIENRDLDFSAESLIFVLQEEGEARQGLSLAVFPLGQGFQSLVPKFWPLGLVRRSLGLSRRSLGLARQSLGAAFESQGQNVAGG